MDSILFQVIGDDRAYVFLAGLAVFWISFEVVWRTCTKLVRPAGTTQGEQ